MSKRNLIFIIIVIALVMVAGVILILFSFPKGLIEREKSNNFCERDNNCIATCAHGCANKNWMEDKIDCLRLPTYSCQCINNRCVKKQKADQLSITADKREYRQGEKIKLTLTNHLSKSIFIQATKEIWGNNAQLERRVRRGWQKVNLPQVKTKFYIKELKPGEKQEYIWNQQTENGVPPEFLPIPGVYRIKLSYFTDPAYPSKTEIRIYSAEFVIKKKKTSLNQCIKDSDCQITGCSRQICAREPVMSTCEHLPKYACYQKTQCKCINNKCQWEQTKEFLDCLQENNKPVLY